MASTVTDQDFEHLLESLRDDRGFDFTGYKRASLMRRLNARMQTVKISSFREYQSYLESHPTEFAQLFDTILIQVTEFFRDGAAWETLSTNFLPKILERAGSRPIRVWSAGCATGQETYSIVMLLAEALGPERFERQVKMYATDADEDALRRARTAVYTEREIASVPEELREKYFNRVRDSWAFRQDFRRLVIFGRHDLTRDAPISHLDLLLCRNVLMYLTTQTQQKVLSRFHFAMDNEGLLFLGRAEMMRSHASLFAPVDIKARIFRKATHLDPRDRLAAVDRGQPAPAEPRNKQQRQLRLQAAALDVIPLATISVDASGTLVMANNAAQALFELRPTDLGRPFQDLTLSYRPVEMRSRIEAVRQERRPAHLPDVEWPMPDGRVRYFDLDFYPHPDENSHLTGVCIAFTEVTRFQHLRTEYLNANQELETAFEELQSTNEELETTNEELQSTIEELETTNEELQSTNEELETMNEELQSTNGELETMNVELNQRTTELNHVNAYMGSILGSLRVGVIVLDSDTDIRVWNSRAEDLWGLRASEVNGRALQNLDIGLPVERLKAVIRACMDKRTPFEEVILDAVNRRGKGICCRVTCTPMIGEDGEIAGVVLLMEEWREGSAGAA